MGAAGILGLSGSQAFVPTATALDTPLPPSPALAAAPPVTAPAAPLGPTWPTPAAGSLSAAGLPTGFGTGTGPGSSNPYGLASSAGLTSSGIPQPAYQAYVAAAQALAQSDPSCGLSWTVIAGIGRVESNHGRFGGSNVGADGIVRPSILGIVLDGSRAGTARISDSDNGVYDGNSSFDRAVGPMQFLPGTWKTYGNGANPQSMNAAALATARYLCAGNGDLTTQKGRWSAVFRYNHSDSYVSLVLSLADSYASGHTQPFPAKPAGTPPPAPAEPQATPPGPPPSVPATPKPPKPGATPTGRPATPTPKPSTSPKPTPSTSTGRPTTAAPSPTRTTPVPTTASPKPTPSGTCPTPTVTPTATPTPKPTVTPTPEPGACPAVDEASTPDGAKPGTAKTDASDATTDPAD